MIVMINGSFGVGKTTVSRLLCRTLPGSVIYDPEWVGYILMRLPKGIRLKGSGTDDYQDIDLWRKSVVAGTRLFRRLGSGAVIVPMTFSHRAYFDEVVRGISGFDPELRIFCLKASLATIQKRLMNRGTQIEGPTGTWITRRIIECAAAHNDAHFGQPVETEDHSVQEIVEEIVKRL